MMVIHKSKKYNMKIYKKIIIKSSNCEKRRILISSHSMIRSMANQFSTDLFH